MHSRHSTAGPSQSELLPIEPIKVLWRAKLLIIFNFFIVSLLAAMFSYMLPIWYRSSATILPPQAGGSGMQGGMAGGNPLAMLGLGSTNEELGHYISILKSRRLRETVIKELDLMRVYSSELMDDALSRFDGSMEIAVSDEGALTFSMYDRDSLRAKLIVDAILRELGATTIELGSLAGQVNRRFIYARIEAVEQELMQIERKFRDFTARYGTYDLPAQIVVVIEQLVQMELQLAQVEVEFNVASRTLDERHPQLELLRNQRDELGAKLEELMAGTGKGNLIPNLEELPDITIEFVRLKRDMEIQGTILAYLYPQYEQARLQEAKDEPTLQVLDYPHVPQKKAKPTRSLIVIAAGLFSLIVTSLWILIKDQLDSASTAV